MVVVMGDPATIGADEDGGSAADDDDGGLPSKAFEA